MAGPGMQDTSWREQPVYEALVMFIPAEVGGRSSPALPGYHPQVLLGDALNGRYSTSCVIQPRDGAVGQWEVNIVYPVTLQPLCDHLDFLAKGKQILLLEGSRIIGIGKIV